MDLHFNHEDISKVISLVHEQLETFKYIGGVTSHRGGSKILESGEGLPLSIVTLPDFVLDFHKDNINAGFPVCSVGGHAGHITRVLLHLMSDEDATHRVHFLTLTGRLGRMLLNDAFEHNADRMSETVYDTYKRYCEPFVFIRDGQPRCAYLSGSAIGPSHSQMSDEITADNHIEKQRFVAEAIETAQAVYMGSFKTPDCANILNSVLKKMSTGMLFVDTRRADASSQQSLQTLLLTLKDCGSKDPANAEIVLFVGDDEQVQVRQGAATILRNPSIDLPRIANDLGLRIIHYSNSCINFYSQVDGEVPVSIIGPRNDIMSTQPSVKFRAGIILAATVYNALELLTKTNLPRLKGDIGDEIKDLHASFENAWKAIGGRWAGAVAYGIALASVEESGCASLRDGLLKHVDRCECAEPLNVRVTKFQRSTRVRLDSNSVPVFVQLAARRRHQSLQNSLIAQCKPVRCGDDCSITDRPTAIMIDLDGTLMDSTTERGRALELALARLHSIVGLLEGAFTNLFHSSASRLNFFEQNVYALHAFFKWLNLGDFRQEWNHSGWYAAYIVLANNSVAKDSIQNVAHNWKIKLQDKSVSNEDRSAYLQKLREDPRVEDFISKYESVLRNRAVDIEKVRETFSHVQLNPFKEVHDLLTSLKACKAFNLYVVSEGHSETQWKKLRATGLDKYIDRSHLLTTGDVAPEYDSEWQQFDRERYELDRRFEETTRTLNHIREAGIVLNDIESDVFTFSCPDISKDTLFNIALSVRNKHREKQLKDVFNLKQKKEDILGQRNAAICVDKILARLRDKLSLAFYAAVIRAIMRNPDRPLDTLRNLQRIRNEEMRAARMKLAMIGDRQTKDLHPPLELLVDQQTQERKGLVTIRLLSGKYAAVSDEDPNKPDFPYYPDYMALTLAQVKAILLSPETWHMVPCLDREPPLFNWGVNLRDPGWVPINPEDNTESIGVKHILCGMSMSHADFPVISNICASFLAEYCGRCVDDERRKILEYLFEVEKDVLVDEGRAARLAAFVLAGALVSPPMQKEGIRFAETLKICRVNAKDWVIERVLNALHWIKDYGQKEARDIAVAATK